MSENIIVGIADMKICRRPDTISTLGLGSCVCLVLYEPLTHLSIMMHIMLPDSSEFSDDRQIFKYADTSIAAAIKDFRGAGILPSALKAKLAGGARMFAFGNDVFSVGKKNVEAVHEILKNLQVNIVAEDCGGNYGRTVTFSAEDFTMTIKSVGRPLKTI